ncbi:MAG: BREX system ATP-binding domain-containing protein [Natronosporangium sp.]
MTAVLPAQRGIGLPGGGAPVRPSEYLDFLATEYLASYVARGGAAIKLLVVGDGPAARELADGLATVDGGFVPVVVDAASTKVHMIDQLFFAVARQLDWADLAAAAVRSAYQRVGSPPPTPPPDQTGLTITEVAAYHELDATELYRSVRRSLENAVLHDLTLAHEFRVAMLRLCQALLGRGDVSELEQAAVLGWLHGEKVPAAELRRVSLHAREARHNARPLLVSLTRWLRRVGRSGLVLQLDLERLAVARRPPAGLRDGLYYTKAMALDAYEVLRQLIDGTDELEGLFVAVLVPPELVTDEARGLPAYTALQLRVADEVRDRRRPNPYAALVRVGGRMEAVR